MSSQDLSPFAHLLRQYRRAHGLTQEALAEHAGLSTDAIRALERGRRAAPRAVTLGLLADALALSAADRATLVAAAAPAIDDRRPPLPLPPDAFIGRERELAAITDLLGHEHGRLVTLIGPGGVGKTRLALEVLTRQETGVFVDLSPLRDATLVPVTIAHAAGVRETGQQDPWRRLLKELQDPDCLLVLDNFEQVVDAAPVIGEALARCPRLRLLVTSRRALRLRGEQRFPVGPLTTTTSENGEAGAAVRLFLARARAGDPGFAPDEAAMATIATICERLDGLPLAIELAAARIGLLPLDALLQRLDQSLALLTGGGRDLPDRHQTMRAAVDWSYQLLAPGDQAIFRRLAVFRGGATLEAATAIAAGDAPGPSPDDVLAGLTSLLDGSLLSATTGPAGSPRIEMLDTVHAYATEQLALSGEEAAMRRAHAGYFLALAEQTDRVATPDQAGEPARLERDHDNLRAALGWCLTADPAMGLRLAAALWQFWWTHGHLSEGRGWLGRLLAAAPAASATRAQALLGAGYLASQQSDWLPARTHFETGLALSRALGDDHLTAHLLEELGWLLTYIADFAEARPLLEEALAICRTLPGDSLIQETALVNLARLVRFQGEGAYARALLQESLTLAEARQSPRAIAAARVVLGDLDRAEEQYAAAETEYQAALVAARTAGHSTYTAWAVVGLGLIDLSRGDLRRATEMMEEGLTFYRELGNLHSVSFVLHELGVAAARAGDPARAISLLRESLQLRWQLSVRGNMAATLEELAMVIMGQEQPAAAARYLAAAARARSSINAVASPVEVHAVNDAIATLQITLGVDGFARAWLAGETAPLEETVRDALGDATATSNGASLPGTSPELHHESSTRHAEPSGRR